MSTGMPTVGQRVTYRGERGVVVRLGNDMSALGDKIWAVIALNDRREECPRWIWLGQSDWEQLSHC